MKIEVNGLWGPKTTYNSLPSTTGLLITNSINRPIGTPLPKWGQRDGPEVDRVMKYFEDSGACYDPSKNDPTEGLVRL